jgi:AraC-like DNA-binding protein
MIDDDSVKKELISHLDRLIGKIELEEVIFTFGRPLPRPLPAIHSCSRIICLLSGRKSLTAPTAKGIERFILRPGQIVFAVRDNWSISEWDIDHTMISVVYNEKYTRILYIDCCDGSKLKIWHHTAGGLCQSGLSLIQTLNSLALENRKSPQDRLLTKALMHITRQELIDDIPGKCGRALNTFHAIKDYMMDNCHLPVNRGAVAMDLGLNPSHVSRLFSRFSSENFNSCLKRLRMERAGRLLNDPMISVEEVAHQSGFEDSAYFIKSFKGRYGVTPGQYRRNRSN